MIKVLLVDSWLLNNKVIEQDTQKYFEKNNIEYKFFECVNEIEAIDTLKSEQIDIAYIDISSEKFDGLKLLQDIKNMNQRQPKIVAVTVLYDKKYRYEALKLKVFRYIYKPYDIYEIQESLSKLFNNHNYSLSINEYVTSVEKEKDEIKDSSAEDDFLDFDEFDEFEEDEDDGIAHSQDLMDAYNKSHKQVTAEIFLETYNDVGIDTEELSELEEDLDVLVASILYDDLDDKIPDIVYILEKYNRFLYMFTDFEELCKVIYALVELLQETNFSNLKHKNMVKKFIIAIIEDLVDWKEHVFIIKDAVDVYYINASILNSFVLLKDIVNKK